MTTLVTGARGFVGRAVMRRLDDGVALAREDCDLTNASATLECVRTLAPTRIVHLAAAGVDGSTANHPEVAVTNLRMAVSIVEAGSRLATIERPVTLVVAGSMAEYGAPSCERIAETTACFPTTAYGVGKLACTSYALARRHVPGLRVRVARLFGVYGPGEGAARLFPTVRAALSRSERVALSDGAQVRDFVHVDDVAAALVALAHAETAPSLANVGTGRGLSVREAVMRFTEALHVGADQLAWGARPRNDTDADRLVADDALLAALLGGRLPQRFDDPAALRALAAAYGER